MKGRLASTERTRVVPGATAEQGALDARWAKGLFAVAVIVTAAIANVGPAPAQGLEESPEHSLARKTYELYSGELAKAKAEYESQLSQDHRCRPFLVRHPVTATSISEYMPGCRFETTKARYIFESLNEEIARASFNLEHVDECLTTYKGTIDKKASDQTTREIESIKFCQSARLYPPTK